MTTDKPPSLKTYVRKLPFYVRARPLAENEVVYDSAGIVLRFNPGDMLIELETDRYTLDRALFDQLYKETGNANGEHPDLPQTESSGLGEH